MKILFLTFILVPFHFPLAMNNDLSRLMASKGYIEISLKKNAVGHYELEGEINGVKGTFTLDTGASKTVLDTHRSKKFVLTGKTEKVLAGGLGTSNQSAEIKKAQSLKLGTYQILGKKVVLVDLSKMNNALTSQGVSPQDGVIGGDILKSGEAVIDYKNDKLFLKNRAAL